MKKTIIIYDGVGKYCGVMVLMNIKKKKKKK